jgi:hypothetical protein
VRIVPPSWSAWIAIDARKLGDRGIRNITLLGWAELLRLSPIVHFVKEEDFHNA